MSALPGDLWLPADLPDTHPTVTLPEGPKPQSFDWSAFRRAVTVGKTQVQPDPQGAPTDAQSKTREIMASNHTLKRPQGTTCEPELTRAAERGSQILPWWDFQGRISDN